MRAIDAVQVVKDGDTVAIGGFGPLGCPVQLIKFLFARSDVKDLHIALNAPNGMVLRHLERLIKERSKKLTTTFMRGSQSAEIFFDHQQLDLVPQGTFAERLRSAGAGIPAFYTPVGVGTIVAEGKETKIFDGKEYLMEYSLPVDVGFVRATKVDRDGNCFLEVSTKNFTQLIPPAAKYTIVEAESIVEVGEIDPKLVTISGIHIDAIVKVGARNE